MQQKENDSSTLGEQSLEHGKKRFASKDKKVATEGATTDVYPTCIQMPEPEASNLEFVTSEDRRYFEDHPQARFYDRAPHPSELEAWPLNEGWGNAHGVWAVDKLTSSHRERQEKIHGSL